MDALITVVIGDIALVYLTATLFGLAAGKCGQPVVVGQIVAGILLGPTLLGRLPGHLVPKLFPAEALPYLNVLSQVAVVVFMFSVGYEIEFGMVRRHGALVPLLALGSLLVPMGLGMASVPILHSTFAGLGMAGEGRSFVLFMGVVTSISALPVLAAIVRERNLTATTPGVVATAAAGIMDVLAWLALAAALIAGGHTARYPLPVTVALLAGFIACMFFVVRPAIAWWTGRARSVLANPVPVAFTLAMASAWVTALLGLHPIFGAFLAGMTMRGRNRPPDADVVKVMDSMGSMLLPLFFVVTGLSLDVGTMRGGAVLLLAVIVVIACVGKTGPAYALSRANGLDARESGTIAVLVNTRGLTELIALNVGLADGIIDKQLFAVLVLMAVITTLATSPLLTAIQRVRAPEAAVKEYVG